MNNLKKSKWTFPVVLVVTAIAIMAAVKTARRFAPAEPLIAPEERKAMSLIELTTLDGGTWSLAQKSGSVVLVNFFATWCGPCNAEMPDLVRIWNENHTHGFDAAGISLDEQGPEIVKPFIKQYNMPFAVGMVDLSADWGRSFATQSVPIPLSFLVDKHGRIAKVIQGMADYHELNSDIQSLLKEE